MKCHLKLNIDITLQYVEHGRYETAESPQPSRVAAGLLLSAVQAGDIDGQRRPPGAQQQRRRMRAVSRVRRQLTYGKLETAG